MCILVGLTGLFRLALCVLEPWPPVDPPELARDSVSREAHSPPMGEEKQEDVVQEKEGGEEESSPSHVEDQGAGNVAEVAVEGGAPSSAFTPDLPNELWLDCFSYLCYADLKRLSRVCKHFKELEQSPALDPQAYRAKNLDTPASRSMVTRYCHPVLDRFLDRPYLVSATSALVQHKVNTDGRQWNAYELGCLNDSAVYPPIAATHLIFKTSSVIVPIELANGAVTVVEFLRGLSKYDECLKNKREGRPLKPADEERGLTYTRDGGW